MFGTKQVDSFEEEFTALIITQLSCSYKSQPSIVCPRSTNRNHPWSFPLPLGDIAAAAVAKCYADHFQFSINIAGTLSLLLSWQIGDVTRLCRGSLPLTPHLARHHSLVAESRSSLGNPRLFNNGLPQAKRAQEVGYLLLVPSVQVTDNKFYL